MTRTHSEGCTVLGIVRDGKQVDHLDKGEQGLLILDRTPFYAESGGQMGDAGELRTSAGHVRRRRYAQDGRRVLRARRHVAGRRAFAQGRQPGGHGGFGAAPGDRAQSLGDPSAACRAAQGAGRACHAERFAGGAGAAAFRFFPFQADDAVTSWRQVEAMVNAEVRRNVAAEVHNMGYDDAIAFGAMALFGEKYGDEVRVLKMGEFSTELCGGTHVTRTGDIGLFKIVSEAGVASGVRRIEAVTGDGALALVSDEEHRLGELSQLLSGSGDEVVEKLRQLFEKQKKLERELESLRSKAAGSATADLAGLATDVDGIKVVAARLEGLDAKSLRDSVDQLKQQLGDCVILLAGAGDGRVSLIAGVHGKALGKVKAGSVVAHVAAQIDGKGGGRADMAQGGGSDTPALPAILAALPVWVSRPVIAWQFRKLNARVCRR